MNVPDGYKNMSVWTKIVSWGAIAGLIGLNIYYFSSKPDAVKGLKIQQGVISEQDVPENAVPAKPGGEESSFFLADCIYNVMLDVSVEGHKLPLESGTLNVILEMYKHQRPDQSARLLLTGRWHTADGIPSKGLEGSVTYLTAERQFVIFHKKPSVERMPALLSRLTAGEHYHVNISAFPEESQTSPILIPTEIDLIAPDGTVYTISEFSGPKKGMWYSAILYLK